VSAEHREAAGIAAGDEVGVDIELDTEPRQVTVPTDFAEALEREPAANQYFDHCPTAASRGMFLPSRSQDTAASRGMFLPSRRPRPQRPGSAASTTRPACCWMPQLALRSPAIFGHATLDATLARTSSWAKSAAARPAVHPNSLLTEGPREISSGNIASMAASTRSARRRRSGTS
jgi:hypothetical protein